MMQLELSKLLSPVNGPIDAAVEGRATVDAGDPAETPLPSFRQLLQTGAMRLAGASDAPRSPRAELPTGEPLDRPTTGASPVTIPEPNNGTMPRSDAARLNEKGETVASIHDDDSESTDEAWLEIVWPGLPLCLASRAALRNEDSPKGERSHDLLASPAPRNIESLSSVKEPSAPPAAQGAESTPFVKETSPQKKEPPATQIARSAEVSPLKDLPAPPAARSAEVPPSVKEAPPLVKELPAPPAARNLGVPPLVKELPAPPVARSAEAPLLKDLPAPPAARSAEVPPFVKEALPPVKEPPASPIARSAEASPLKDLPAPPAARSAEVPPFVKEASPLVKEPPAPPVAKSVELPVSGKHPPESVLPKPAAPEVLVGRSAMPGPVVEVARPAIPTTLSTLQISPTFSSTAQASAPSPMASGIEHGNGSPAPVVAPESNLAVAKIPVVETTSPRLSMAETVVRPVPVIDPATRFAGGLPDRVVRLEARGGGQPTTVVSPDTMFEEETGSTIDESRSIGRERLPAVDPNTLRSAGERPSQPRLAEPFTAMEPVVPAARSTLLPETRSTLGPALAAPSVVADSPPSDPLPETIPAIGPAPTAPRVVAESNRPVPPANPDSAPLAILQPGRQPSTAEAVVVVERSRPESAGDSAVNRTVALDAATAGRPTVNPAGPVPATPVRPDAGMPPTLLPTAPEALNLLQKNWGWMLGRQLHWMINNQTHEAKISVNPPHLGPLEVRMALHQNQTSVTFFSHEAVVREALESAMPRLRELLDSQGLHLNQAQVSDQSLSRQPSGWGEQASRQRDGSSSADTGNQNTAADEAEEQPPPSRRPRGVVDHYV